MVEDDPINREVAIELLSSVGLEADSAENGQIAVDMASQTAYDLILMDMQMPVMDGLEATRKILALPDRSTTPIVAMTANAFGEDRASCLAAGMVDHLAKPVEPTTLYQILLHWLPAASSPPATQPPAVSPAAPTSPPCTAEAIIEKLAGEHGFDTVTGLDSLSGKADKYIILLGKFLEHHEQTVARTSQALAAGDRTSALRHAHTPERRFQHPWLAGHPAGCQRTGAGPAALGGRATDRQSAGRPGSSPQAAVGTTPRGAGTATGSDALRRSRSESLVSQAACPAQRRRHAQP